MNYKKKRKSVNISQYTMAKHLGIDKKTYADMENNNLELSGEYLDKFMDVINNAREINFNRDVKLVEIRNWVTSGQALKDMENYGYTQTELAKKLGVVHSYVNHLVRDKSDVSDDFREEVYDFLHNPFNKNVREEKATTNEKIVEETPKETKIISEPIKIVGEVNEDKEEKIKRLEKENARLELDNLFLKESIKRLFKI